MKRIVILLAVFTAALATAGLAVAGGHPAKINLHKTTGREALGQQSWLHPLRVREGH